jgi:hypothetical protein
MKMRLKKISSVAVAVAILASVMVFVQCSEQKDSNEMQSFRALVAGAELETPEIKAKRAAVHQRGIERINKMVSEGKMDQARADFSLKRMANMQSFMDNNPEWTKYLFAGKKFEGKKDGKKDGKKFEGKKDGKKFEGKKCGDKKFEGKKRDGVKKDGAKIERPKKSGAELKASWEKKHQERVDRINQKASEGKMEKAHADFLLKFMANDKAFKDANPEWTEHGFMGKGFRGGNRGEGKGERRGEKAKKAK